MSLQISLQTVMYVCIHLLRREHMLCMLFNTFSLAIKVVETAKVGQRYVNELHNRIINAGPNSYVAVVVSAPKRALD